jgi:redox-sensitive bicupin YhaK (pirin superfamily)
VIKGKLRVIDNGETNVFGPGKVFWETGSEMTVENIGATEAEILIIELAPVTPEKHKE